ncbi:MAG: hypothetical protein M0002_10355, partial [Rhodospirillales bacterium]|nr:hypothetical protein [Rhodospirillales bacterium]
GSLSAAGGTVTLASASTGTALDLTTGLASAPLGTFLLGDAVANTAAITATTLTIGAGNAGAITITNAITFAGVSLLDLLSGDALTETNIDSLNVGTLAADVQSANLPGSNAIGTLAAITATGGFAFDDTENLTLAGLLDAGSATAQLSDPNFPITEQAGLPAGGITAGTLTGSATSATLNEANAIGTLGVITAPGGFTLNNPAGFVIAGNLDAGAATVLLTSTGAATENGGSITAGFLSGSLASAILGGANNIAAIGSFTARGGLNLTDGQALTISSALDIGTAAASFAISGGSLGETGAGLLTAGTLSGSAALVSLANTTNVVGTLGAITAPGGLTLATDPGLTISGLVDTAAGVIDLTSQGSIAEVSGGTLIAGELIGAADNASFANENTVAALGSFTALGGFTLADGGSLALLAPLDAGTADVVLIGGAAVSEPSGSIDAGTLAADVQSANLPGRNTIATLGAFSTPGALLLTDAAPLAVAGPVTADLLAITDTAGVAFTGSTGVGTLSVNAGGSVTEPSGTITANLLDGSATGLAQFGPDAPAGSASIATLGPFSVANGSFSLTDAQGLAITGPFAANYFAIAAPGSIVLESASITTLGLAPAAQSGNAPVRPGSYFSVTTPGGQFLALGNTLINPAGGPATLRIQLSGAGGLINFTNLVAPTTTLLIATGSGTAIGRINLGALVIIGNLGSSTLTGTVANLSGLVAASKATINPFQSARYRLNSCPIMSVNCIFIAPVQVPQGNPLSGLAIVSAPPDRRDTDLLLPNVAAQDY